MTDTANLNIDEAKRQARAELEAYRERKRLEREATAKAEQTADDEIAAAIHRRRTEEARQTERREEYARMMAAREERLVALREAERTERLAAPTRPQIAESSARRLAKLLRVRLGDDFEAFVTDLRNTDWRLFWIEIARIPGDEAAEALHRQRQAEAALRAEAAKTLPVPETHEERTILARYGFAV